MPFTDMSLLAWISCVVLPLAQVPSLTFEKLFCSEFIRLGPEGHVLYLSYQSHTFTVRFFLFCAPLQVCALFFLHFSCIYNIAQLVCLLSPWGGPVFVEECCWA